MGGVQEAYSIQYYMFDSPQFLLVLMLFVWEHSTAAILDIILLSIKEIQAYEV